MESKTIKLVGGPLTGTTVDVQPDAAVWVWGPVPDHHYIINGEVGTWVRATPIPT